MARLFEKQQLTLVSILKLSVILLVIYVCSTLWTMDGLNGPYQPGEEQCKGETLVRALPTKHTDRECSKQLTLLTHFAPWNDYPNFKKAFQLPDDTIHGVPTFTRNCPKYRCNITVGVTLSNNDFLAKTDGVVVNIALIHNLPSTIKRLDGILPKNITWFFFGIESPLMFQLWDANIANINFHNDITYHSQSAMPLPYGYFVPCDPLDKAPQLNWANGKTHLITWMSSNCRNTFWPRTEFVYELQKYIPVDMYGNCGNLTCLPRWSTECLNKLQKYKFYLALENAECNDYMTEKFWANAVGNDIVPVVYGGQRSAYEKLAPPNSFIHVGDFANTRELANYLLKLDKNDKLYNKYFQWRLKGHVKQSPVDTMTFCETIPLIDSGARVNSKYNVSQSKYFNSCRGKPNQKGSLLNWSPWK